MRVLVTGANGFIGVQICRLLLQNGYEPVALYHRNRERLAELAGGSGIRLEQGDIQDEDRLRRILTDSAPAAVCHLAVQPPGAPSPLSRRTNVDGTGRLLEACRLAGVNRLIYTSSMSVYDFLSPDYLPVDEAHPVEPLQEYGREKWEAEELCRRWSREYGMRAMVLRLAGVYGPGKSGGAVYNFTRAILHDEPVIIEQNRRVDLLYVDDAARAVVQALERAEEAGLDLFNIGSGRSVALDELVAAIGVQTGRRPRLDCRSHGNEFYLDISRARAALDFSPLTLEEGLSRSIPWVEEEIGHVP